MHACLYRPPLTDSAASASGTRSEGTLVAIAEQFSPRYERHHDDLVSIDVSGLDRLLGPPRVIGEELRREAAARGIRAHVAVARTRMAALVVALARPGLTVVPQGEETATLAPVRLEILEQIADDGTQSAQSPQKTTNPKSVAAFAVLAFKKWGLKTLGEVAALPAAGLVSRLGRRALEWQAIARGDDIRPLVPTLAEERFESSIDLEWSIEELEPLSFVLTRLIEPLSTRLERRDRGAAVLHVLLQLVTRVPVTAFTPASGPGGGPGPAGWERVVYARRLELPSPMRDVRTLRTLALLDLESHPPDAAIDRVTIVIDPTPGRVLQHALFTRAHPTPEQISTLLARLGALMGQDRFGTPVEVDTYRPGAFVMAPFATEHNDQRRTRGTRRENLSQSSAISAVSALPVPSPQPQVASHDPRRDPEHNDQRRSRETRRETFSEDSAGSAGSALNVVSALRRCRHPVPARVAVAGGRPVRVTTDRRGFTGGAVVRAAGPWRTSGEWWATGAGGSGRAGGAGGQNAASSVCSSHQPHQPHPPHSRELSYRASAWSRDEWDVSLSDGAMYRIFQDRETEGWFIDAIVD